MISFLPCIFFIERSVIFLYFIFLPNGNELSSFQKNTSFSLGNIAWKYLKHKLHFKCTRRRMSLTSQERAQKSFRFALFISKETPCCSFVPNKRLLVGSTKKVKYSFQTNCNESARKSALLWKPDHVNRKKKPVETMIQGSHLCVFFSPEAPEY